MPVRKSEMYDDPLRRTSKANLERSSTPIKIQPEKVGITVEDSQIEWSNLIFIPFHPVFRMFVLFAVFIKAVLVSNHY